MDISNRNQHDSLRNKQRAILNHNESNEQLSLWDEEAKQEIVQQSPCGRFKRFNDQFAFSAFKVASRAYDADSGREIIWNSVKILRMPSSVRMKVCGEINEMKKFNHPNLLKCLDSWNNVQSREVVYITEMVHGGTLKEHLYKINRPKLKIIKNWALQILQGLSYIHNKLGLVHANLNCDNILINSNTNSLKLTWSGLLGSWKNQTDPLFGCPQWSAPELSESVSTPAVDVYSFGMTLLQLVTRKSPYSECLTPGQVYKKIYSGTKPQGLQEIANPSLKSIIKSCIELDSQQRPTVSQLIQNQFWRTADEAMDNGPIPLISLPSSKSIQSSSNYGDVSSQNNGSNAGNLTNNWSANHKGRKLLSKKPALQIQVEQEELKRLSHQVERRTKENQTVFVLTLDNYKAKRQQPQQQPSSSHKPIQFRVKKCDYTTADEYDELVAYLTNKLEDRHNNYTSFQFQDKLATTREQQNISQTKSQWDSKKVTQDHDNYFKAKQEQVDSSRDYLMRVKELFKDMYETYHSNLENLGLLSLNDETVESRLQLERKQLELIQQLEKEKDRKRMAKKNSRNNNVPPPSFPQSPCSVMNLIEILNLQGHEGDITDHQHYEDFKNIMNRNDDQLTINFSIFAKDWMQSESKLQETLDRQQPSVSAPSHTAEQREEQLVRKTNQIFIIAETKEDEKSKDSVQVKSTTSIVAQETIVKRKSVKLPVEELQ